MGALISLPVGATRTVVGVVQKYVLRQNKPLRIDLPLPFIPIDLVLVTDAAQIVSINKNTDVDRLHSQPTEKLPAWIRWYFSATRFHNKSHDKWFLPFEPPTAAVQYEQRRDLTWDKLSSGFKEDDVKQVADQVMRNDSDEQIAFTMAQVLDGRFIAAGQTPIPAEVVKTARKVLKSNIGDALRPGRQSEGEKAQEATYAFCEKNSIPELNVMDATHNVASVSHNMVFAINILKENIDTPIDTLFTRKPNCPTPSVPRVVVKESTLNGLLSYPGRPTSTIVFLSISDAAEQTNSLFFTFGSGGEYRVCPFKQIFVDFMTALQAELKARQYKAA